jgi:hypothetical protein
MFLYVLVTNWVPTQVLPRWLALVSCPDAGALGQHQVFPLGIDDLSSLYVFGQLLYPDFELTAARRKYYQGWSDPG